MRTHSILPEAPEHAGAPARHSRKTVEKVAAAHRSENPANSDRRLRHRFASAGLPQALALSPQRYSTEMVWLLPLRFAQHIRSRRLPRCTTPLEISPPKRNASRPGTGLLSPSSSRRQRQLDPKCRSSTDLRSKVYRTVVKLYNSERARQSDAAAAGTRGKKKLKDLLPIL